MRSENNPDKIFKVAGLAKGGESWKAFFSNMSTSRAARKENWGREVAQSIQKPEIFCFCGEVLALT